MHVAEKFLTWLGWAAGITVPHRQGNRGSRLVLNANASIYGDVTSEANCRLNFASVAVLRTELL